ncbi:bifunctional hydroxymethylpyrimidine kinase/phosphomethylpyrimidine kinase [Phycicoccus sp. CSK15P-2]|uniref:bifunctional hydroxymethylpyrimidine kinase/phosphomethylpyrimidine kinase n=1 Tax=Phycicoccus sp. CSK15P-2 TaxID=2807627 RepID=UPI00194F74ED|nr:bifunctional hydroxymethylpyrimidine kinase/phosphomethylpyrimidine kinase [Phycicoccus sp. CSK15P-2]MBM6404548.1 bifunctional hydroxymethylpyrimidine kinase/phosphomethylpyrimidine kinase [Phycicoccus sp. CSK15P-2]
MTGRRVPRVLSVAGTDPTGGAGIHADLKSIAANGGYGMAVVTALVAQNTHGVRSVHVPPVEFLAEQLDAVSDDVEVDAVKIGMLGTPDVVRTVREWLERVSPPVVVLDPVMVATSGDRLLDEDAEQALRGLARHADVLTPNVPELALLADEPVAGDWGGVLEQARRVSARYGVTVLAKGGHLDGDLLPDAVVDAAGATEVVELPGVRIETTSTHGTGCSLSAALATRYAACGDWVEAAREAKHWLAESIRHGAALEVGSGHGPVSHFAGLWERGGVVTRPTPDEVVAQWWEGIRDIREGIDALAFVRGLGDGSLEEPQFLRYLAQDALYLRDYSRVLAEASRLAPTAEEQGFWAASAQGAVTAEMQLHESRVPPEVMAAARPGPATTAYLDHLLATAARGDYAVLVAAVLPCFWVYQDVGERLHPASHPEHPYRSWLDTYADEAFATATRTAVGIVARTAARADAATRDVMYEAFRRSAAHELAFFAAPAEDEGPVPPSR